MPAVIPEIRIAPWGSIMAQMGQGESTGITAVLIASPVIDTDHLDTAVWFTDDVAGASGVTRVGILVRCPSTGPSITDTENDRYKADDGTNMADNTLHPFLVEGTLLPSGFETPLYPNARVMMRGYVRQGGSGSNTTYSNHYWVILKGPPELVTADPSSVGATSATLGGTVTNRGFGYWKTDYSSAYAEYEGGGTTWVERGLVVKANGLPTVADNDWIYTDALGGETIGSYSRNATGLSESTNYWVRAYATNSHGTSYGQVEYFTTGDDPGASYSRVYGKHEGCYVPYYGKRSHEFLV